MRVVLAVRPLRVAHQRSGPARSPSLQLVHTTTQTLFKARQVQRHADERVPVRLRLDGTPATPRTPGKTLPIGDSDPPTVCGRLGIEQHTGCYPVQAP